MSNICYSPNWEGGMDASPSHSWDKSGDCILCGHSLLKPLNAVIQVCPICGKVDVFKGDGHSCFLASQNQYNINEEYK